MNRPLIAAIGLCALVSGAAQAAPYIPLGTPRAPVRLGALQEVTDNVLFDKIVVTSDGRYLGWVEDVEYIGSFVTQVKVSMDNYANAAWIFVEEVKYDPVNKVVVVTLPRDRIRRITSLDG